MAGTRKARVPMAEQIRLINECRQSGMTDADWCRDVRGKVILQPQGKEFFT